MITEEFQAKAIASLKASGRTIVTEPMENYGLRMNPDTCQLEVQAESGDWHRATEFTRECMPYRLVENIGQTSRQHRMESYVVMATAAALYESTDEKHYDEASAVRLAILGQYIDAKGMTKTVELGRINGISSYDASGKLAADRRIKGSPAPVVEM